MYPLGQDSSGIGCALYPCLGGCTKIPFGYFGVQQIEILEQLIVIVLSAYSRLFYPRSTK